LHLRRTAVQADIRAADVAANSVAARLAATHAVGAAVMLAFSTACLLGEDARRVGLAAEALALLLLAVRTGSPRSAVLGHGLMAVVAFETLGKTVAAIAAATSSRLGAPELSELAVVSLIAGAAALLDGALRDGYFIAAEVGLLAWLFRMLDPLANGAAFVTAAWFANAVVLVVAGLGGDSASVRSIGAAVMALTMAKLFLFDLATVDALWRIATFVGFGAVLLGLGYAFPTLWRRRT
jgi:hypothetical protein